jgi:hypothetical protein
VTHLGQIARQDSSLRDYFPVSTSIETDFTSGSVQPPCQYWSRRCRSGHHTMTSQGTPHGRFQRAIHARHVQNAEMAAREMGGLSLADALLLCELLANADPQRYERAALRWLQRFIDERLPPLTEAALAASALAELRQRPAKRRRVALWRVSWTRSASGWGWGRRPSRFSRTVFTH